MTQLNISVVLPDKALQEIQDKIDGEAHVPGARAADVAGATTPGVFEIVKGTSGEVRLDLIAHSRDHQLHVGSWLITDTETQTAGMVGDLPSSSSIIEIRLLGCVTAKRQGRAAMRHVRDALRKRWPDAKVFGATSMLYARHYDTNGFAAPNLLVEVDNLPPAGDPDDAAALSVADVARLFAELELFPEPDGGIDKLLGELILETEAEARFDWSRYSSASTWRFGEATGGDPSIGALIPSGTEIRVAPGLLLLPDRELLYPVSGAPGRFHRVTSLFHGMLLRVYPRWRPGGVIVRPTAPVPLPP